MEVCPQTSILARMSSSPLMYTPRGWYESVTTEPHSLLPPLVVCNDRFYITYANPAFSKMIEPSRDYFRSIGSSIDDLAGKNIDWVRAWHLLSDPF